MENGSELPLLDYFSLRRIKWKLFFFLPGKSGKLYNLELSRLNIRTGEGVSFTPSRFVYFTNDAVNKVEYYEYVIILWLYMSFFFFNSQINNVYKMFGINI